MAKYVDDNGLLYFWGKVKARITASLPTKTSQLANDSGYITSSAVPPASGTAPKMDGTAAAGTGTTWARADHVHPTDTTRAAQADLTSHAGDSTAHVTSDERSKWEYADSFASALTTKLETKASGSPSDGIGSSADSDATGAVTAIGLLLGKVQSSAQSYADTKVSALGSVLSYKGSCAYADLPASPAKGDVWNVTDAHGDVPAGTNWAWNGSAWDALGGDVDLSAYATTSAVDAALAKKQDILTAGSNVTISGSTISARDTTYAAFKGATDTAAGSSGLVPAPPALDTLGMFLGGDGKWQVLPLASASTRGAVVVDSALSSTSANPVQNKAVQAALAGKQPAMAALSNSDIDTICAS